MQDRYAGWHLTVDGIVGEGEPSARLGNVNFLTDFLTELVELLQMEILGGPHLHEVEIDPKLSGSEHDEGGLTGVVIVTTSHVSIHTWPLRNRFSLDVFSCKEYDHGAVLGLVSDRLGILPGRRSSHWIVRNWA